MNDSCDNCYWYWTGVGGYECHHYPRPRHYDSLTTTVCEYYEPKLEPVEHDEAKAYEQFQKEWN